MWIVSSDRYVLYSIQITTYYCLYLFVKLTIHHVLRFPVTYPVCDCISVGEERGRIVVGHFVGKVKILFICVSFNEKMERSTLGVILALLGLAVFMLMLSLKFSFHEILNLFSVADFIEVLWSATLLELSYFAFRDTVCVHLRQSSTIFDLYFSPLALGC